MMAKAMETERSGVAAARARRLRLFVICGLLAGVGGVIGFFSAMFEREGGGFLEGIPAIWAIAASIVTVLAIVIGGWRYHLATDELDRRDSLWASAMAMNVYLLFYACWYFWWKGGVTPEPSHEIVFIVTLAALLLAYGYKKIRP